MALATGLRFVLVLGGLVWLTTLVGPARAFASQGPPAHDPDSPLAGKPLDFWVEQLKAPDALSREEALLVLLRAGREAESAAPHLEAHLASRRLPERFLAALALWGAQGDGAKSLPILRQDFATLTPKQYDRLQAFAETRTAADDRLLELLVLLGGRDPSTAFWASQKLARLGQKTRPAYARLIEARQGRERAVAVGLAPYAWLDATGGDLLAGYLGDAEPRVRLNAATQVLRFARHFDGAVAALVDLAGRDDEVGTRALAILAGDGPPPKAAEEVFVRNLKHPSFERRFLAVGPLLQLRPKEAALVVPVLEEALRRPVPTATVQMTPEELQRVSAALQQQRQAVALAARVGPAGAPLVPALLDILRQPTWSSDLGGILDALAPHGDRVDREVAELLFTDPPAPPTGTPAFARPAGPGALLEKAQFARLPLFLADEVRRRLEGDAAPARKRALRLARSFPPAAAQVLVPPLRKLLLRADPESVALVLDALERFGPEARVTVPDLLALADQAKGDGEIARLRQVLRAIGPTPEQVKPWLARLQDQPRLDGARRMLAVDLASLLPDNQAQVAELFGPLLKDKGRSANPFEINDVLSRLGPEAAPLVPLLGDYLRHNPTAVRFLGRGIARIGPAAQPLVPLLVEMAGKTADPYDLLGLVPAVGRLDPARQAQVDAPLARSLGDWLAKYPDHPQSSALLRELARQYELPLKPSLALEPLLVRVFRGPASLAPDVRPALGELLVRLDAKYRDEVVKTLEDALGEDPPVNPTVQTRLLRLRPDHPRARAALLQQLARDASYARTQALRVALDCDPGVPGLAAAVEAILPQETQTWHRAAAYVILMRERGQLKPEWVDEIFAAAGQSGQALDLAMLARLGKIGKPLVPRVLAIRADMPLLADRLYDVADRLQGE